MSRYAFAALLMLGATAALAQSDAQLRQRIVEESIGTYPGSCPCPYSTDRAGRRCGARSAYSRPGGAAPRCYPSDVSQTEITDWRRAQR